MTLRRYVDGFPSPDSAQPRCAECGCPERMHVRECGDQCADCGNCPPADEVSMDGDLT